MKLLRGDRGVRVLIPALVGVGGALFNMVFVVPLFSSRFSIDFPLLVILYYSFFEDVPTGIVPVLFLAGMREALMGGAEGGFFFGSVSLYFGVHLFFEKFFVESETFLFFVLLSVFAGESVVVSLIRHTVYEFSPPSFYVFGEVVRIVENSFIAIPLYYSLQRKVRRAVVLP
ncbi:MAG: hypothetical protein D6713_09775 [Deltaproteobacteria bacterium]|nr:MAG: hypothetical protein D6713_09775 [Deltaproteobacteria bacterium]